MTNQELVTKYAEAVVNTTKAWDNLRSARNALIARHNRRLAEAVRLQNKLKTELLNRLEPGLSRVHNP